jgi:hypothetical protein
MSLKLKSTRITVGAAAIVLALGAAAAFGYWTSSGEGTSTVTASSGGTGFEIGGTASGLYPGGTVEATVTVKNKDAQQPEYLTNLVTSIKETGTVGCEKSWFTVTSGGSQTPKVDIAAGETKTYKVSVSMSDTTEIQNACKGATIVLKAQAS